MENSTWCTDLTTYAGVAVTPAPVSTETGRQGPGVAREYLLSNSPSFPWALNKSSETSETAKHPLHSSCTLSPPLQLPGAWGDQETGMGEGQFSRPWSGTALRAIVPATGLRGSWSRLWSEMCLHICDQPPGGWLCPLVNSPVEPSMWTPYRNTTSAAPGFSLFQFKFFNSLQFIGLFVANKPATQGGAEGVLPHQVLGLGSGS